MQCTWKDPQCWTTAIKNIDIFCLCLHCWGHPYTSLRLSNYSSIHSWNKTKHMVSWLWHLLHRARLENLRSHNYVDRAICLIKLKHSHVSHATDFKAETINKAKLIISHQIFTTWIFYVNKKCGLKLHTRAHKLFAYIYVHRTYKTYIKHCIYYMRIKYMTYD